MDMARCVGVITEFDAASGSVFGAMLGLDYSIFNGWRQPRRSMRILIADDNESVRRGVVGLILSEPHCQICGESADGAEAVSMARALQPDLIILDVSMPSIGGLEASRLIRQELPRVKILIMSHHDPAHLLPRAIEAGADACVDKCRLDSDLVAVIQAMEQRA